MNSGINKKSTKELRGEVMSDLRKLNRDIDQLKNRLSPGQLIDDALSYRAGRSPRATFDFMKENPVGTSFLALGTLLLMEDQRHRSFESIAKEKTRSTVGEVRHKIDDATATLKSRVSGHADMTEGRASRLDSAKRKFAAIKGSVSHGLESAKSGISSGVDALKSEVSSTVDSVKGQAQEGQSSLKSLGPMTYVALGAGLGALSGASLPFFEKEKELAVEASAKVESWFTSFSEDLQDAINKSANILKSEVLNDFSEFNIDLFSRGQSDEASSPAL